MAKQTKPRAKDPVALAKAALAGVLDRAIGSKDDERILASAKQVLTMLDKPTASNGEKPVEDRWVTWLNAEELNSLSAALDECDRLERVAKARRALGGDPPDAHVIGAGSDQTFWRDTQETPEERQARYDQSKSSIASPTEPLPTTDVDLDQLDEDEIDVTDLIEAGIVIPEEPES